MAMSLTNGRTPRILFFLATGEPSADELLEIEGLDFTILHRNAARADTFEPCDGVSGAVPALFKKYPNDPAYGALAGQPVPSGAEISAVFKARRIEAIRLKAAQFESSKEDAEKAAAIAETKVAAELETKRPEKAPASPVAAPARAAWGTDADHK